MKTMPGNKGTIIYTILLMTVASTFIIYAYSTGVTGETRKNGIGCYCHNESPSPNVTVTINGPDILKPNETGNFTLTISGGPLVRGGTDIAASAGVLIPGDGMQKIGDEITHVLPKVPVEGVVTFQFQYTAPGTEGTVTLYANGNSVNFNGINDIGDQWNYADNKIITISNDELPVELAGFTASVSGNDVILKWTTATEENNRGFEVQRLFERNDWKTLSFISGSGTTTQRNEYSYVDKNLASGKYIYRLKQNDFDGTFALYNLRNEIEIAAPLNFSLEQNYPNPFNPTTNFGFQVANSELVTLKIYDVLGKEVATLLNEEKEPGFYNIQWDAESFSSGVYYYIISAGKFTDTKKLILLR